MKTIENAKQIFFTDKQHYLNFRKAWSQATKISQTEVKEAFWVPSHTTATHHLVYNLLRGKAPETGFTPITNRNKLSNGMRPNRALEEAFSIITSFGWQIEYAQSAYNKAPETNIFGFKKRDIKNKDEEYKLRIANVNNFLSPFKGTVSIDTLLKLATMIKEQQLAAIANKETISC